MKSQTVANDKKIVGAAMVVGGGIGGIQASLDLADSGYKVYLVEESPAIGGRMAQLDKTFPTNDCSMCILSPKLVECGRHPNIELLTCCDLLDIQGEPGDFNVKVLKRSRYIDARKCTGCGECATACPVEVKSEFDQGLGLRKAAYRPYAQAFPNAFTIDKKDRPPCTQTCPASVNAQGYVALISKGEFAEAYRLIQEELPFPGILGRICPHPCETECRRAQVDEPVAICELKRFVADKVGATPAVEKKADKGKKVGIIGSGPAGLTAAHYLAREGYRVTVFEALPVVGGMLYAGIPEYRLPRDILAQETGAVGKLGVEFKVNTALGKDISLDGLLQQGYEAVFLAVGAHKGQTLGIPGEDLLGVVQGVGFLHDVNLGNNPPVERKVAVVGGGNVAIDAARAALRLGAEEVTIVYRRSETEMPASNEEVEAAITEGVKIEYLAAPVKVVSQDGKAAGLKCTRMKLGEPDASGRRRPVAIPGSEFVLEVDQVIPAIGQVPDLSFLTGSGVKASRNGTIEADPLTLTTSRAGVFAGGDCQSGPGIAIEAVAAGKRAAESIRRYLEGEDLRQWRTLERKKPEDLREIPRSEPRRPREAAAMLSQERRQAGFAEVGLGFSEEQAVREASRCLNCGICSECFQCVAVCKAGAVDHKLADEVVEFRVGSVVLAPGYEASDPKLRPEYGYGRYRNVVTSLEFERILSASGPYQGRLVRPGDGKHPKKIAWIQCVASRDTSIGRGYCSSVCCMQAIKQAVIAREHQPGLELAIFYNDIRAYGKGFEAYYDNARKSGVRFIKTIVSSVKELQQTGNLLLSHVSEGQVKEEEFDLVVLSVGLSIPAKLQQIAKKLDLKLDGHGFCQAAELSPTHTSRPGVFVCGAFESPRDIPETVMQAGGAAAQAAAVISSARGTLVTDKKYPPERDVSGEPPRIGVFVCHCGINIAGVVNVPEVADYARTLRNVVYVDANLYTCSQDTQERIKEKIKELGLNRVVVASCTPRTHEPLFQETIREAGLNPYLFTMANIRDQCSWVHMHEKAAATEKAKDLVRIAVARSRTGGPLAKVALSLVPAALVVGGGIAGMQTALGLAGQGFEVHLVEKDKKLGGMARRIHFTLEGADVQPYLRNLIEKVSSHPLIHVHTGAEVLDSAGYVGNFSTKVRTGDGQTVEVKHGAAIVAIGGQEYKPEGYLYGKDPRVMTLLELEEKIAGEDAGVLAARDLAIVLCAGSRQEGRNYCSRMCCSQAIKTILKLKELRPEMNIYVLYRDIRTYGLKEDYYRKAREAGVLFVRYEPPDNPRVETGDRLSIEVTEPTLGEKMVLQADLLALGAATLPPADNKTVSQLLKTSLDENGFFLEAHVKLRPVEFAGDGLFLCGLAHGPKSIEESIIQAQAAVSRATTVLSRKSLLAGGAVSAVDMNRCNGCGLCADVCAFGAVKLEHNQRLGRKVAVVTEASCKGCGVCASTCRCGAIDLRGFSDAEILEMVDALGAG